MNHKVIEIFYLTDEFCKEFDKVKEGFILQEKTAIKKRNRKFKMSDSEVITIVTLFHLKSYRCLKHFYIQHVQKHMVSEFPETVSYNRFVDLQKKALMPMAVFLLVMLPWKMHRSFFYRFHTNKSMSHKA